MSANAFNRRTLIAGAGGSALLLSTGGLSACSSGNNSKTPGNAASVNTSVVLPTYIPYTGLKPDLPGTEQGVDPAFRNFPKDNPKSVPEIPGKGETLTGMAMIYYAVPPGPDQNSYWQGLNERLGVKLDLQMVSNADYTQKFATTIAGNKLPDMLTLPNGAPVPVPNLPQLLEKRFTNLSEHLSGDAVKEYPNLGNIPTLTWKSSVYNGGIYGIPIARAVLTHVFDYALRLLHPIMPFITETLWQRLPFPVATDRCEFLAIAPWPIPHPASVDERDAVTRFDLVREAVSAVRQIRSDYAIPPGKSLDAAIQSRGNSAVFGQHAALIGQLARASVTVADSVAGAGAAHSVLSDGSEVIVPLGGLVDLTKECGKLRGELEQLETQLQSLSKRLQSEGFIGRAPAAVVESERKKETEWIKRREQLAEKVKALCGG